MEDETKDELLHENERCCHGRKILSDKVVKKRNRSKIAGAFSIAIILESFIAPLGVTIWCFVSVVLGVYAIVTGIHLKKESGKLGYGFALGIIGIALSVCITRWILSLTWS